MRLKVCLIFLFLILLNAPKLYSQISILSELSFDREANLGESYNGSITIRNETEEPQEAKIYQTDYLFQADGINKYGEPGSNPRSNASWIVFSPSFVTLPPQGIAVVNFTITVPNASAERTLVGTYWSMLMVEGIQKGSAESTLPDKNKKAQMGIAQTIRYGIQISTTIIKTGTKKIQLKNANLIKKENGKRFFQVDIENIGDLFIRPDVYIELFNEQGESIGKYYGSKNRIYPTTSVRQNIDVSSVTGGTYKALIVVDAGGEDVFGAQYTLIF